MLAFWSGLSPWHLLLVLGLALLFYGNRLPEVARSLGKAVNEFKRGLKAVQDEVGRDNDDDDEQPEPRKLRPPADEDKPEPSPTREKQAVKSEDTSNEDQE